MRNIADARRPWDKAVRQLSYISEPYWTRRAPPALNFRIIDEDPTVDKADNAKISPRAGRFTEAKTTAYFDLHSVWQLLLQHSRQHGSLPARAVPNG